MLIPSDIVHEYAANGDLENLKIALAEHGHQPHFVYKTHPIEWAVQGTVREPTGRRLD